MLVALIDFFVGIFIRGIVFVLGKILLMFIHLLVLVAQYNDFINSPAVTHGWVIVRDLVNMFFVMALLIIAFGTVLGLEKYQWQKVVPHLLIIAVLINFSKVIAGFFIDIGQVVMLTFVNGFQAAAGGNFVTALGIGQFQNILPGEKLEIIDMVGAYLLAIVYSLAALVVVMIMTLVLFVRMITLWFLIILSPLAFFLSALPQTQSYATQWWERFSKAIVVGPILAFFLWLSLLVAQTNPDKMAGEFPEERTSAGEKVDIAGGAIEIASESNTTRFIISLTLLIGGLMISYQFSGTASALGGLAMGYAKNLGVKYARWGAKKAAPVVAAGALLGPVGALGVGAVMASRRLRGGLFELGGRVPIIGAPFRTRLSKMREERAKDIASKEAQYKRAPELMATRAIGAAEIGRLRSYMDIGARVARMRYLQSKGMSEAAARKQVNEEAFEAWRKLRKDKEAMTDADTSKAVFEFGKTNVDKLAEQWKKAAGTPEETERYEELKSAMMPMTPGEISSLRMDQYTQDFLEALYQMRPEEMRDLAQRIDMRGEIAREFLTTRDPNFVVQQIENERIKVRDLTGKQLDVPVISMAAARRGPLSDLREIFKDEVRSLKLRTQLIGANVGLGYKIDEKTGRYSDVVQRNAEVAAAAGANLDAFRFDRKTMRFDPERAEDKSSFEQALKSDLRYDIAFSIKADDVRKSADVGRTMADTLTKIDLAKMAEIAKDGTREQQNTFRAILAAIDTYAAEKPEIQDKLNYIKTNIIFESFR